MRDGAFLCKLLLESPTLCSHRRKEADGSNLQNPPPYVGGYAVRVRPP